MAKLSLGFWRSDDHTSWYSLITKRTRCTNFSNLFWNKILHVSDSSSVHHVQFFTVHTAMDRFADSLLASCQQTCMTYTTAVCTVKNCWWWTEELSKTCRILFQNKFEKLMYLVGFVIRILSLELRVLDEKHILSWCI